MLFNKKKFQLEMQSDFESNKRRKMAVLPPIIHSQSYYKDPYENSFLMSFDLKKKNEDKLKKILFVFFLLDHYELFTHCLSLF